MEEIKLRRMRDNDQDYMLLVEWFKEPEVTRFYSTHPTTLEEVKQKYQTRVINAGNKKGEIMVPVIIMQGYTAVGYLQYYSVDYEEYGLGEYEEYIKANYQHPYAIDIFLGKQAVMNHGIGRKSLKILVKKIFETTNSDVILIDPNALNTRAIHCYEKVGFHIIGTMKNRDLYQGKYTDSILMGFSRRDFI